MQRFEEPHAAREPNFGHPWYKYFRGNPMGWDWK